MSSYSQLFSNQEKREYNDQITKKLLEDFQEKLKEMYQSSTYQEWLNMAAMFPNYSINNQINIMLQRPDATMVCAAGAWKKMGRYINKGAKSIKILAPNPYKRYVTEPLLDESGKQMYGPDGKELTETKVIHQMWFKPVSVFDVSDTNGKELPSLSVDELKGRVDRFPIILDALKRVSPVPISFIPINDGSKGYFSPMEQGIFVKEGMDEIATCKTIIHEISHALLHDKTNGSRIEGIDVTQASRKDKEMQAESCAYIVCKRLGLDTSDYSLGYVASWGQDPDLKLLSKSLETINKTASEIINQLDEIIPELISEKDLYRNEPYHLKFVVNECNEFPDMANSYTFTNLTDALEKFQSLPSTSMIKGLNISFMVPSDTNGIELATSLVLNNRFCDELFDILKENVNIPQVSRAIIDTQAVFSDEVAYKTKDGFVEIHKTDSGFDYTLYNSDYKLTDGGILELDTLKQAIDEIRNEHGPLKPMSHYSLMKLVEMKELSPLQTAVLQQALKKQVSTVIQTQR